MIASTTFTISDSFRIYMREIGQFELLTIPEEWELAAKIAQGCVDSRDRLIVSNLRLVVKIAHDFRNFGNFQDIVSAGNLGLFKACERFDPFLGAKFSSYAAWWIKQSIRRCAQMETRIIRIPISINQSMAKVDKAKREIEEKFKRSATVQEISHKTDLSLKHINGLKLVGKSVCSLDETIDDNKTNNGYCFISEDVETPIQAMINKEFISHLDGVIDKLEPREKQIIIYRFGLRGEQQHTLEEVSYYIELTRERARQIQNQALKKLRRFLSEMN